jgi:hypothetical protein
VTGRGWYFYFHRSVEIFAIGASFLLMGLCLWQVREGFSAPYSALLVTTCVFLGYLFADFMSGVVHWAGDRLGSERTLIFGPGIIKPFRDHHSDARGITRHDFIETNGNNCMAIVLALGIWAALPVPFSTLWFSLTVTLVVASFATFGTNQFHKWAHFPEERKPRFMKVLQRWHLILPTEHHNIHHTWPHEKYFCITTGWMNWPLTKIRFFEGMEWFVERVLHIPVFRDDGRRPQAPPEDEHAISA